MFPNKVLHMVVIYCCLFAFGIPVQSTCLAQYERRTALVEAISKTKDTIVNIQTIKSIPASFSSGNEGRVRGLGAGVLIDPRGFIVTNYHVVEEVDKITVVTSDKKEYRAWLIRYDSKADLAILKLESKKTFPFLSLNFDDKPLLGETVIAIGNPYGLDNTISTGIISAVDRRLKLPNGEYFDRLIQTDASINPGNSGGPLININGNLIGVNVAIRSNAQGIGFAIPTDQVRKIVSNLMLDRKISPYTPTSLGLHIEETDHEADGSILLVDRVEPASPAEKFGLQQGDRVLEIDGQPIQMSFDLARSLWYRKSGDKLDFKVQRGDKTHHVNVTIETEELSDADAIWKHVGIRVSQVSAKETKKYYTRLNGGLKITDIRSGSFAEKSNFRVGDVLIGLHDYEMINPNNIRFVLQWDKLAQNQPIKYYLLRNGKMVEGKFRFPTE